MSEENMEQNDINDNEENLIENEPQEENNILSNSKNIELNENKAKEIVNSSPEEEDINAPGEEQEQQNDININQNREKIGYNQYREKITKKKSKLKKKIIIEEKNPDDLFKKAIENSVEIYPPIEYDNNISGKVTEVLYDKYVGKNIQKSKHLDIYSKFRDESIRQAREFNRTKEDAKKISDMIERQEKYEELKHDKKIGRQKEIKKKIKQECVFIPNADKNPQDKDIRSPSDFYSDQKKFIEKKTEEINKLTQNEIDNFEQKQKETKVSKNSEKMANKKNTYENLEQFCKRLAEEKFKIEEVSLTKKKEKKTMTTKAMQDLTEKLHKEGETFKINREKKEKELIDKMRNRDKKNFVLEKSKKVIFEKFVNEYNRVVKSLFDSEVSSEKEEKNKKEKIKKSLKKSENLREKKKENNFTNNNDILGFVFKLFETKNQKKQNFELIKKNFTPNINRQVIFDLLNLNYIRTIIVEKKSGLRNLREKEDDNEINNGRNTKREIKTKNKRKSDVYKEKEVSSEEELVEIVITKEKMIELQTKNSTDIKSFINILPFYGNDVSLIKHRPNREKEPAGNIQEPLIKISLNNFVIRIEDRIRENPNFFKKIKNMKKHVKI